MDCRIGIFDHLERLEDVSLADFFESRLQFIEAADRDGVFAYHLAEHHATPLGMAPSPSVFLSAVAQRTERIRFGPLLYVLPLYEPLRLIEEIAMLDNMSGGRFELGVGRGASPFELAYYNVPMLESHSMFEESVEVIAKGLRNPTLSHRGRHYRYHDVPMEIRPLQQPNPPFWFGAFSPANATFAGARNMNAVCGGTNKMVAKLSEIYLEALNASAPENYLNPDNGRRLFGAMRHCFIADSDKEAHAVAKPAYRAHYDNLMKLWRKFNTVNTLFTPDIDEAAGHDVALVGSAQTVCAKIKAYFAETKANYLVLAFCWGSLTPEQSRRSLELFAAEVMPNIA